MFSDNFPAHVREPRAWSRAYPNRMTWRRAARKYAAEHGEAVAFLANDSVIYFWREGDKVRQKTRKRELGALIRQYEAKAAQL